MYSYESTCIFSWLWNQSKYINNNLILRVPCVTEFVHVIFFVGVCIDNCYVLKYKKKPGFNVVNCVLFSPVSDAPAEEVKAKKFVSYEEYRKTYKTDEEKKEEVRIRAFCQNLCIFSVKLSNTVTDYRYMMTLYTRRSLGMLWSTQTYAI